MAEDEARDLPVPVVTDETLNPDENELDRILNLGDC